ncbi:MAG: alginate lyase family protein [Chitinophagaceae bacterium]
MRAVCLIAISLLCSMQALPQSWNSRHISINKDGSLKYMPDQQGNTIPVFSAVGYSGNKKDIPVVPTVKTILPVNGDNTAHIQQALNEIAARPLNEHGFRGALLLKKGTYPIAGTVRIAATGIVLRGEGAATILLATGKEKRNLVSITGTGAIKEVQGSRKRIAEKYQPTGTFSFRLSSTDGLQVNDKIVVFRPGTKEWISALKMDQITVRDSTSKQWTPKEYDLHFERMITRIEGDRITIDAPLMMPLEEKFGGGEIYKYSFEGRISNVGVENLSCVSEFAHATDEEHARTAIYVNRAEQGWVQHVTAKHFVFACVDLGHLSKNFTVQYCRSLEPKSQVTGGRRYSFNNDGQYHLVQHCYASEGRHDFVTGARVCGPNVFFHCKAENVHADIGPHHRWSVGTLYDNIVTDGEINIQDRGNWGTGHGWAGVTQVLWHCTAKRAAVQNPWVSGSNYSIGLKGEQYAGRLKGRLNGEWEGLKKAGLSPASLYMAQLKDEKHTTDPGNEAVRETIQKQVLKDAAAALQLKPVTITAFRSERSAGGSHDFFSEGDYWWPNPASPDSPYIQKDGLSNPDNFTKHREAMIRFSKVMGSLASAYLLSPKEEYVTHAVKHARAWFSDSATFMHPSLLYAQAIKGRVTGRGIGIIDAIQLMEVAQALYVMRNAPEMDVEEYHLFQNWFARYLHWLTAHPYGIDEMNAKNNHGTCWVMQAAVFAKFTGNNEMVRFCINRYKNVLLPAQMAPDGSFPLELKRTKPYGYSIFNLDAMATICQVLSAPQEDIWTYHTTDGKNIRKGIGFLYPFIADKSRWPFQKDVMYWEQWPVAQPFLLFGAKAFGEKNWLETWKKLEHDPSEKEVIRNLPIRHPLIWL